MQLERILSSIAHKFAQRMPFVIQRKIYSPGRLSSLLSVRVDSERNDAVVDLGSNASFELCLEVQNNAPYPVQIENAELIFWCCGTQLCSPLPMPESLAPGERHVIHVKEYIAPRHASQIGANRGQHQFGVAVALKCHCELHDFFKATGYLGGIRLQFANIPLQGSSGKNVPHERPPVQESYASA